jgi:hypothetical protein
MKSSLPVFSIVCIVILIISSVTLAQSNRQPPQGSGEPPDGPGGPPGGPGGPGSEEYLALLTERLQLTDQQVEDVTALFEEQSVQMQAIFEKYKDTQDQESREAMMNDMQALREVVDSILEEILTGEQMEVYGNLQEEQRQQMEERREQMGEGRPQGPPPQNQP